MIEAAAQLRLRITLMDRKFSEKHMQTEHETRVYLAWVGSLARLMTRLDSLKGVADKPPALQDYLAARSTQTPAAAA